MHAMTLFLLSPASACWLLPLALALGWWEWRLGWIGRSHMVIVGGVKTWIRPWLFDSTALSRISYSFHPLAVYT
jgi:hypothetical protein